MKKFVLASAAVVVLASMGMAQAASTGTITFNGELTATTCDVSIDSQGPDSTVVLPTISINNLAQAGETAGRTGFNIGLSNCAGTLRTASAFFETGNSVDPTTGRLTNVSGTATNVSLQLRDSSSPTAAVIMAGNSSQATATTYRDISSGTANLPYSVEYFANGATTAGTVISNVVYSIQYQ